MLPYHLSPLVFLEDRFFPQMILDMLSLLCLDKPIFLVWGPRQKTTILSNFYILYTPVFPIEYFFDEPFRNVPERSNYP